MDYPVKIMCDTLQVSRSAYYAYCKGNTYALRDKQESLCIQVAQVFHVHKRRYGSRRIRKELENQGIKVGRHAIRTAMKEQALKAIQPKSFVPKTTDSRHKLGYAPNLLADRNFPTAPNEVYVGDITYLPTTYGKWLYLSTWMDLYSRVIVGWKVDIHMEESLIIESLEQALYKRSPSAGLIIHSDRGGQYAGAAFKKLLKNNRCLQSMSEADNPYDNAFAESLFSRFKAESLPKGGYESKQHATKEIYAYIEMYYNTQRLHSSIDYQSPSDYENKYYQSKNKMKIHTFAHPP
jgi:putative transposase